MIGRIAARCALTLLLFPLPTAQAGGQYVGATRAGFVRIAPADSTPPRAPHPFFAPPTSEDFTASLGYVGLTSALGAGALAVAFHEPGCRDCGLWGAAIGSSLGAGVGAKIARSQLRCEHSSWDAREAFGSFLVHSVAIMIGRADARAGLVTAAVGVPLATSYFVAGCDRRQDR